MNDLVRKRWARILIKRDSSELSHFVMACPVRTMDGMVVVLSRKSPEITQALPPRHECWDGPQLGETEGQGIIRSSDPVSKCPPGCKSGRDGISGINTASRSTTEWRESSTIMRPAVQVRRRCVSTVKVVVVIEPAVTFSAVPRDRPQEERWESSIVKQRRGRPRVENTAARG